MARILPLRSPGALPTEIFSFLRQSETAVLSTVDSSHKPRSSPISYLIDDTCHLSFVTRETTNKFKNITHEPSVSVTVVDAGPVQKSVQMEGVAIGIVQASEKELFAFIDRAWTRPPFFPNFLKLPGHELFLITIRIDSVRWFSTSTHHEDTVFQDFRISRRGRTQVRA